VSEENENNMPFLGHLEELRWRLVRSSIAILIFGSVIFWYTEWITTNVFLALAKPDFPIFSFFCWAFNICSEEIEISFQSIEMSGQFSTNLMMAIFGGLIAAFPYVFYQLWSFVKPGLKPNELKTVRGIVWFVSILFFMGILFGYYVVAPLSVQFLGGWQMTPEIDNIITINSYLRTIVSTVFFTGLLFLLPVVILIFSKLGIITPTFLRKYRKHAVVIVLIVAAVITPPDLMTQIVVAIPILLLYEFGILISRGVEKRRIKEGLS
jgi:sec-independent protein translocase protein TatC